MQAERLSLYRGDRVGGWVQPGRQFSDGCLSGLAAKYINGGGTAQLNGRDFVDFVLDHVGCVEGTPEDDFMKKSPLVSFSASRDVAMRYMTSGNNDNVQQCLLRDAEHLLFQVSVEPGGLLANPVWHGVFELKYKWSLENCWQHVGENPMLSVLAGDVAANAAADGTWHQAQLIDVVAFLREYGTRKPEDILRRAQRRAEADSEWLLYPADPFAGDPTAPSAIFLANKHLVVQGFQRQG